ncbi:MAG: ATPase, BadF/BadG/BcrA/BcrD type [Aeromicrobium sp.]|nr:ATPase, BadF/BadG/BcrA/BcrD type [Aeromicrobium sp.]
MNHEALVMGADVGGTSTRVLVASLDGEPRGSGRAAGGNPTAWPAEQAAASLASAVSEALTGLDPSAVRAVVLGLAGGGALDDAATAEHFDRLWSQSGVRCVPRVVGDLEIAFASATPEPDGTVVVSGTGAAAATIHEHTMIRSADGYGWLLGDAGSGYWLGREAVRHTLARLDARLPATVLSESVLTVLLGADRADSSSALVRDLVRTVNSRPPVQLAQLGKVVEESADQGDTEAAEIIERASLELIGTIQRVREPAAATPLVMVGGVLRPGSRVNRSLRAHLAEQFAGPVLEATDGVAGATWLAARSVTKDEKRELASHRTLTGQG